MMFLTSHAPPDSTPSAKTAVLSDADPAMAAIQVPELTDPTIAGGNMWSWVRAADESKLLYERFARTDVSLLGIKLFMQYTMSRHRRIWRVREG